MEKRSLVFYDAMEHVHLSNSILIKDKYQDDANSVWVLLLLLMLNTHFLIFSICFIFKLLKVQAVMLKRLLPLELDDQLKTITVQEMLSPMPVLFRNWIWTRRYTSEEKCSSAEAALSLCAYVFLEHRFFMNYLHY